MATTSDPSELDDRALACRAGRHNFPQPGDSDFQYIYHHRRGGEVAEAEIHNTCRRGCGVTQRAVFDVLPGPRFIPKRETRYDYDADRPYLIKYSEGQERFTRADARGVLAARLDPKKKWPRARSL